MPWKEWPVSEQRICLVQRVLLLGRPVAAVAREFGVSRKTACKWLARYRADPAAPLADRSRRPHRSPGRTDASIEDAVLAVRAAHRWGPRKIHRVLRDQRGVGGGGGGLPSIRTVATILSRRGCLGGAAGEPAAAAHASTPPQPFERGAPNELWQVDHKGPVEVARQRVTPLSVLDDHSRYLLRFAPVTDVTMATAWSVLWDLFGEVGLPASILCDNAFGGAHGDVGLSWFDAHLVRLGVAPVHGRPYHPQTQGKVERLHGTALRELIDFDARRDSLAHFADDGERWRMTYNALRPHESLGDEPPVVRWRPSDRPRPPALPEVTYPSGSITRRVSHAGDVRYRNARVLLGRGLAGQIVRVEERDRDVAVYYAWKLVRVIGQDLLGGSLSHKMV